MSDNGDQKVVQLPSTQPEVSPEERARWLIDDVERLARMSSTERLFYQETDFFARKHGIESRKLKEMIEAAIKENEKKEREVKADNRRAEQRGERKQQRDERLARQKVDREERLTRREAERIRKEVTRIEREQEAKRKRFEAVFAEIAALPRMTHEVRVAEAAKRLGEDLETLREEFEVYRADRGIPAELEAWPDPVDTAELLAEIENKFRRYVVVSDMIAAATTLWVPSTYLIEIAVHAPKLLFHFPEKDAGKSTALGVLRWMVQRPYPAVEATGAAIYRVVDRLKPTLLLDEADKLFQRNTMLAHVVNASWTNGGQKIPRVGPGGVVVEYDPYSTQAIAMKGLDLPDTTLSRCIPCMIWPKLPSEKADDFTYTDDEEFRILRRKLARWAVDNAAALRDADPASASGFNNRIRQNWRILLAIADLARGNWPKRARAAALELRKQDNSEPSDGMKALAAMRELICNRDNITSAEVCKTLTADPTSGWANFRGRGPISQTQFAALLKPYGIYTVKLPGGNGYRSAQFKTAFARLLQIPTKEPENPSPSEAKPQKTRRK